MSETAVPSGAGNGMSRREELLSVATRLFAARGYHGTRMDDVADAVGLNKATVYHYYASKSLILYDIYKGAADFTVGALHDDPSASAREVESQQRFSMLSEAEIVQILERLAERD